MSFPASLGAIDQHADNRAWMALLQLVPVSIQPGLLFGSQFQHRLLYLHVEDLGQVVAEDVHDLNNYKIFHRLVIDPSLTVKIGQPVDSGRAP